MMSKLKNNKSNIATLSSTSSSSSSVTSTTTNYTAGLPDSVAIKSTTTPTGKEKRRLQQRRNSSSPVTRINYVSTVPSPLQNHPPAKRTEFTTEANRKSLPFHPTIRTSYANTNSTNSLNSPSHFRRSRIPVIIPNSPSHHISRRSLSARLRTPSEHDSTTAPKSSNCLFTSPPTFRKRISASLSRESSPGGPKFIVGQPFHPQPNHSSSLHSRFYHQQQADKQKQQQQHQLSEQKQFHQHQLNKQHHQPELKQRYNDSKRLPKHTTKAEQQQQYTKQPLNYHSKGYCEGKGIHNGTQTHSHSIASIVLAGEGGGVSDCDNSDCVGASGAQQTSIVDQNIDVNQIEKLNLEFSERKYIVEMSTPANGTDEDTIKIIEEVNNQQKEATSENNVNSCSSSSISKPTTTTTVSTESTIYDMANKIDDLKVTANEEEDQIREFEANERYVGTVDTVDSSSSSSTTAANPNGFISKIDESVETGGKIIPNGNCVVENQMKCPNCCSPKPQSCSPISPIAEEEESPSSNNGTGIHGNPKSSECCNSTVSSACNGVKHRADGAANGVKTKRNTSGMTLNLNGPSTSSSSNGNSSGASTSIKARTPITPKTPHTPKTPSRSTCPSTSYQQQSKLTPRTPPVTPDSYNTYIDDDLDSVYSYSSGRSTMSCDHPYVARNGTTFSGRKMKYVVHCSAYAGQTGEDYLTPTQRAQRQLRRLKELLTQARTDLEQKDSELLRLTREVVELRLFKASLSSPEDPSNSSDAVTVREALTELKTSQDVSPIVDTMLLDEGIKASPKHVLFHQSSAASGHLHHHSHSGHLSSSCSSHQTSTNFLDKMCSSEMQSSFADSGHFEDMTTSHSTQDQACGSDNNLIETYEEQRAELIRLYEKKIEELIKSQDEATGELKQSHNDRIEALLQKLADINTRYADIVPDYEQAKEKIRELEKQLEDLQQKLLEHEETQKKMYLHMYQKGQEAERIARAEQIMEIAHRQPNRVSIPELLQQLQSTQDELENIRVWDSRERGDCALLTAKEAISLWVLGARKTIYRRLIEAKQNKQQVDPEITLQFLKSAIYYFLTDKENSQGHLNAIESILEFSEQEKKNINKARNN